jgi:hypothetical protein
MILLLKEILIREDYCLYEVAKDLQGGDLMDLYGGLVRNYVNGVDRFILYLKV